MKMVKRIWHFLDFKQKVKVVFLLLMILLGGIMETLGVTMVIPLLNAIADTEGFARNKYVIWAMHFLNVENVNQMILFLIIAVIFIFIFKNVYLLIQYYAQAKFINNNRHYVSKKLLALYLNRPYEYFLNMDTPTILRTIYSDMDHIFNLLFQCMLLATEIVVAVFISIVILVIDFKMTLMIVLLMFLVTLFISGVIKKKMNYLGDCARIEQASLYKWILQSVTGVKDVKVFGKENYFVEQYGKSSQKYAYFQTWNTVFSSAPRLLLETIAVAGILGYIGINVALGSNMQDMLGLIGAFGIAALRLLPSVNRINGYLANIAFYEPSLDYLCENVNVDELKQTFNLDHKVNSKQELTLNHEIVLKQITYAYPNTTKLIFDNAGMIIPAGKSVGVMGISGAGKTTIVDILLGLLKLKDGMILCDGKNIFDNMDSWLANIGYIPQTIYMLDDTVRKNVAFGVEEEDIDEQRVWNVLEEAQLKEYVEGLDNGLDSEIGERGIRISGGQRQRLGIARALYHNPEFLVFDEATSALDNDTETAIMEAVENLHGRKTMVIIAHRLRTIENCDIIYEVKDGKIVQRK